MRATSTRKGATILSAEVIAGCRHEALRLSRIRIAERCPRCRLFVRADGRTFELASQAITAEEVAS